MQLSRRGPIRASGSAAAVRRRVRHLGLHGTAGTPKAIDHMPSSINKATNMVSTANHAGEGNDNKRDRRQMRDISSWSWHSIVGLASGRPDSMGHVTSILLFGCDTCLAHTPIKYRCTRTAALIDRSPAVFVLMLVRFRFCIVILPRTDPQDRCASISLGRTDSWRNDEIPTTEIEFAEEWPGLETTQIMLSLDTYLPVHFALHHRASLID